MAWSKTPPSPAGGGEDGAYLAAIPHLAASGALQQRNVLLSASFPASLAGCTVAAASTGSYQSPELNYLLHRTRDSFYLPCPRLLDGYESPLPLLFGGGPPSPWQNRSGAFLKAQLFQVQVVALQTIKDERERRTDAVGQDQCRLGD